MADKRLEQLPTATTLGSSDLIHISQSGIDKRINSDVLVAQLNSGVAFNFQVKEESSTERTLSVSDRTSYIRCLNTGVTSIIVPPTSDVPWTLGDQVMVRRQGGKVNISGGSGVTINGGVTGLSLLSGGQDGILTYVGSNIWDLETGGTTEGINGTVTDYDPLVTYTEIDEWVREDDIVYRPDASLLPIGPEAFDASKWIIAQITGADDLPMEIDGSTTTVQAWSQNTQDFLNTKVATVADLKLADISPGSEASTYGYSAIGDEGAASYIIKTLSQHRVDIDDATFVPDGYLNHYINGGTTNVAIFKGDFAYPEQFGQRHDEHASPTYSCQTAFNAVLKVSKIKIKDGRFYDVDGAVVISGDEQYLEGDSQSNKSGFRVSSATYKGNIVETENFPTVSFLRCTLRNLQVYGNIDSFTTAEVNAGLGTEGIGFALTLGSSDIYIRASTTFGVGICFSNGGDFNLYTAVNSIYADAARTGQEGVIFDGYIDARVHYVEGYLTWDSSRDFDYTSTKASKYTGSVQCAGVLFRAGSAEVTEMHPNNNRHGYAFATSGVSGQAYRLRFAHAIGEGSAGGCRFGAVDDVTGALLNVHSTRGKFGLPLCNIESLNNVQIASLNVKVDALSGYPESDGGTYQAVSINGNRAVIDDLRVWSTTGRVSNAAVYIEGEGHKINGNIHSFNYDEDDNVVPALRIGFPTEKCLLNFQISSCGEGLTGASGSTDPGIVNLTLNDIVTDDINSTYMGFLSSEFFRISNIYNQDTTAGTLDVLLSSGTISASEADGLNKSVSIPWTGLFTKAPSVKSITVSNMGSSSYNGSGIDMWVAGITATDIIIKYNIDSYSGDFTIRALCGF